MLQEETSSTEKKVDIKLEKLLDDGTTNNFGGCEIKWKSKLDAFNLWKYIEGKCPDFPELREDEVRKGVKSGTTEEVTFITKGNREAYDKFMKDNQPWLDGNKRALSAIIDAIPDHKLYLVKDVKYAADAWKKLRAEYKPMNARTIVQLKQELMGTRCASHSSSDIERWLVWMIGKRQSLLDADPNVMSDIEFARHIITLMLLTGKWTYLGNELSRAMIKGTLDNQKLSSSGVIASLRDQMKTNDRAVEEEVVMNVGGGVKRSYKEAHTYFSIPPPDQSAKRFRPEHNPPTLHSSTRCEEWNANRPPYPTNRPFPSNNHSGGHAYGQQQPRVIPMCTNTYCQQPRGHFAHECLAYGGGKVGQYPSFWRGPWDIHVHPSQRGRATGAQQSGTTPKVYHTALASGPPVIYTTDPSNHVPNRPTYATTGLSSPNNVYTDDNEQHMASIVGSEKIFLIDGILTSHAGEVEELAKSVNGLALTQSEKGEDTYWDTGATSGVFHDRTVFKDYVIFDRPIQVNGFGSNLATIAQAMGSVELESEVNGVLDKFTLTEVLHIPNARCNLVSAIRMDRKGAYSVTGNGKVTIYICGSQTPFVVGEIQNNLYKLKVHPIIQPVSTEANKGSTMIVKRMTRLIHQSPRQMTGWKRRQKLMPVPI
jgi:hypothetical protein